MTTALLSRAQFALTLSFHFVFPPVTIGLGMMLVIMQACWLRTRNPLYREMAHFWTRIFGLIFAIGVATGIPMEFQFGTNWASYSRFVGDIFGSPLAIEGVYAFFMESGFLALLLFGWDRVGPVTQFFATCMVTLGAHFSAIWILVANSWMQTPAGYHLARQMKVTADGRWFPATANLGSTQFAIRETPLPRDYVVRSSDLPAVRAVVDNIGHAIFNPSTIDRLSHTIIACWITGAFLVIAVSAYYLLKGRHTESARAAMRIGLAFGAFASVLQLVAADATARGVAINQPTKLAAIEGLPSSRTNASLALAGWIGWKRDASGQIVGIEDHTIRIPDMLSILVSGEFLHPEAASAIEVRGLSDLPSDGFLRRRHSGASSDEIAKIRPKYWPNVPIVFQTYHLMIAIGMTLIAVSILGCILWMTGKLWETQSRPVRIFLWVLVGSAVLPELANQAGWFTAEMGRQPWIVYGVLKTTDGVSAIIRPAQVVGSLILFAFVYLLLTALFGFLLINLIQEGPRETAQPESIPAGWELLALKGGRETRV